jgi:hypothetical protein
MGFKIRSLAPHHYDYSSVWNEVTQEATLRLGLVAEDIDPALENQTISFASAQKVEFVALDVPEMAQDCSMVTNWQFEYTPGLQNYLMLVTLKGSGCKAFADAFDILQIRFRFYRVLMSTSEPIDVAVDISR